MLILKKDCTEGLETVKDERESDDEVERSMLFVDEKRRDADESKEPFWMVYEAGDILMLEEESDEYVEEEQNYDRTTFRSKSAPMACPRRIFTRTKISPGMRLLKNSIEKRRCMEKKRVETSDVEEDVGDVSGETDGLMFHLEI